MYLSQEIDKARVLIAVKTYPHPSLEYDELVCNAGFLHETGQWIRIYPIQFRQLPYAQQYKKYNWIELNLHRKTSDLRQESYMPKLGIDEPIATVGSIDTGRDRSWTERKRYALREVFDSMSELIALAKTPNVWKSLATVKPKELIRLEIEEDEREWPPKYHAELRQLSLFDNTGQSSSQNLQPIRKLPYKYYYRFLTEGDQNPSRMMIGDWEIGALYWNCLAQTEGDEYAANELVKKRYRDEFFEKDLYLFVGTTQAHHIRASNPFMIIGVFYPPVMNQLSLW